MLKAKFLAILLLVMSVWFAACGGGAESTRDSGAMQTGTVQVLLTDAPGDYKAVYVTVNEVRVHKEGECDDVLVDDTNETSGDEDDNSTVSAEDNTSVEVEECEGDGAWVTIAEPYKTYDLLALTNGVSVELGEANISTGDYTQLRFILGDTPEANATNILGDEHPWANYIVLMGDDTSNLKVPSNKLQLKHNFEVESNSTYEMLIDFDANLSIHQTGNGKWMLQPVLKVSGQQKVNDDSSELEDSNETSDDVDDNITI